MVLLIEASMHMHGIRPQVQGELTTTTLVLTCGDEGSSSDEAPSSNHEHRPTGPDDSDASPVSTVAVMVT